MFARVTIRVSNRPLSERFYATVLGALGVTGRADLVLADATADRPATQRLHLAFAAPSRAHVDAFWWAGVEAGFADDGAPGPRPQYTDDYYGAFLLDPDGISAEAVHHGGVRTDGSIDHLWIRVADLGASRAFYRDIAPRAGLRAHRDTAERVSFVRDGPGGGTFSLLPGEPSTGFRLGLRAPDGTTVEVDLHDRG